MALNKTLSFDLELKPGGIPPIIHASQGDIGRMFKANIYWDGSAATSYVSGATVNLRGKKPDKTVFDYTATLAGSMVTFETTEQMTIISGPVECELVFSQGGDVIASANFVLMVEDSPWNPENPSESEVTGLTEMIQAELPDAVDDWFENDAATSTVFQTAVNDATVDYIEENGFNSLSQMANVSDEVRAGNIYPSKRITATGTLAITPEEYSGSHLYGTIPYQSNVLLTNWNVNLTPGKYTLFIKSKTGFEYPDKLDLNIYNVSGVTYPLNRREPLVFTVSQAVNSSALRLYLYNSTYSSGLTIDDTLYVYLCAGEYTLADFDRNESIADEIASVVNPLNIRFSYGTIDGNNGEITDYYKYARAYSNIVSFPFPVSVSAPNGHYIVYYYAPDGSYLFDTGWRSTEQTVINENTPFRIMVAVTNTANIFTDIKELSALLSVSTNISGLPIPFERGSIDDGADDTYNQNARARCPICVHDYDVKIETKTGAFYPHFFDDNNTFSFNNGGWIYKSSYIIPAGQRYRLILTLDPYSSATVPVATITAAFTITKVKNRYNKAIEYIRSLKWHFNTDPATQGTWTNHNHGDLLTIAHISDVHADVIRYRNFVNFVKDNSNIIDAAIQTGDIVDAPTTEQLTAMHALDPDNVVLWCTGNHDVAGNAGGGNMVSISRSDLYDAFELDTNTGELYYYKDFSEKGVRLIVLNTYNADNSSVDYDYKSAQLEWFVSTLKDAATNNLSVIVAYHYQESEIVENNKSFYTRFYQWEGIGGGAPYPYSAVEDIVEAFKNGTTVTTTFYNGSITADFTGYAGDFICHLTGHTHQDRIGYSEKHTDQLIINIVCGAVNEGFGRKIRNFTDVSDLPRQQGEYCENAFNIYTFDIENKVVKVLRVGSDMNDQMRPRLVDTFTF